MKKKVALISALFCSSVLLAQEKDTTFVLNEVSVTAIALKTKMRGNALVTKIQGSSLEKSGTVEEMLAKVPGMISDGESLSVIGKGTPLFYINGRKLTDLTELKRMSSEEIMEVEVISNPGATYDSSVKSVVRIRTKKRDGEGFGFDLMARHEQDLKRGNADPRLTANVNYRHKNIDFFGMVNGFSWHYYELCTNEQFIYTKDNIHRQFCNNNTFRLNQGMNYALGTNWQLSERQSLGFRFQLDQTIKNDANTSFDANIYNEGVLASELYTERQSKTDDKLGYNLNAYYNARFGNCEIDWNFDWHKNGADEANGYLEKDETGKKSEIKSRNLATTNLLATKVVVSFPLWKGKFSTGTEMIWTTRDYVYDIDNELVENNKARINEQTYSLFAEYGATLGKNSSLNAGIRYEKVCFNYDDLLGKNDKSYRKDEFYPSLSFATKFGETQFSASFNVKVNRPPFRYLNDAVYFMSSKILQQNSSTLKNENSYSLDIFARWRWFTAMMMYQKSMNVISEMPFPYTEGGLTAKDGVIIYKRVNLQDPVRTIGAFFVFNPTFGCYTMNWTTGVQQQIFTMTLEDPREKAGSRSQSFNNPIFLLNANNTVRLPHSWQIECNLHLQSPGSVQGNIEMKDWKIDLNAAIQKSFLKNDALSLRIAANDLLYHCRQHAVLDNGSIWMEQIKLRPTQRLSLTVRYSFNATKSKYKGKGAGQETIGRM